MNDNHDAVMALLRQVGRRAPDSRHVWEGWRNYRDRGQLSQSQMLELMAVRRSGAGECCCPYCLTALEEFPWMEEGAFCESPGLAMVPRRLLGALFLLPVLVVLPLAGLVWMSVRPGTFLARRPEGLLRRAFFFVFHQDAGLLHLAVAGTWVAVVAGGLL